jgi:hypothetical protein
MTELYKAWDTLQVAFSSREPEPGAPRVHDSIIFSNHEDTFYRRISSWLLLCRLIDIFGMPLFKEADGCKSCWGIDLRFSDGVSVLTFKDSNELAHPCSFTAVRQAN